MSPEPKQDRGAGRKLAEWITLAVSAVLILSVAGYLLYQETLRESPLIAPEIRPQTDRAQRQGEYFVLPVEVRNPGLRTLRDLRIEATFTGPDGREERREHLIEYLGERARHTFYLYLEQDPRAIHDLRIAPHTYHLG